MNGEMYQICLLVNAARNALAAKQAFLYPGDEYVNSLTFQFLPRKTLLGERACTAKDPRDWFRQCVRNGAADMKFLAPLQEPDRALLGFANVSRACIAVFHRDGTVTHWLASWRFDQPVRKWDVEYQEYKWDNPPPGIPRFRNNRGEFMDVLRRIAAFADEIDCKNFGDVFRRAYDILDGKRAIPVRYPNGRPVRLPALPEEGLRLFHAASAADVFGGMGSWNDSPPCCAHDRGLDAEYESLSNELLKNLRLAALYAINEN